MVAGADAKCGAGSAVRVCRGCVSFIRIAVVHHRDRGAGASTGHHWGKLYRLGGSGGSAGISLVKENGGGRLLSHRQVDFKFNSIYCRVTLIGTVVVTAAPPVGAEPAVALTCRV